MPMLANSLTVFVKASRLTPNQGTKLISVHVLRGEFPSSVGRLMTMVLVVYVVSCSIIFPTASIIVKNAGDMTITGVYAAHSTDPDLWDSHLLAPLEPGQSVTISELEKAVYKLRITFADASYKIIDEVDLTNAEEFVLNVRHVEGEP